MTAIDFELRAAQSMIDWAHEELALNFGEIGKALGATRRTVERWRASHSLPSPRYRERMEKFRELRFLLEAVFEDKVAAQQWLYSPVPALRGRSPMTLLRRGDLDGVIGILAALEAGGFS